MSNSFTEETNRVLALLHNARKIAVERQDRRLAMDVLHACALYVKGVKFPCDPEMFNKLASSIIDKRDIAIMEEFAKVEESMGFSLKEELKKKNSWRTIRMPNR
jgi:hypothetical protein